LVKGWGHKFKKSSYLSKIKYQVYGGGGSVGGGDPNKNVHCSEGFFLMICLSVAQFIV